MSDDQVTKAARAAARELSVHFGPQLRPDVEIALHPQRAEQPSTGFFDPTAVASLIVSIAGLAWQIYRDLKNAHQNPTREILVRAVRSERRRTSGNLSAVEENIIEIVTAEFVKTGEE